MYQFDDLPEVEELFLDQDSAVLKALSKVDKGLFDAPEGRDEDLDALYDN